MISMRNRYSPIQVPEMWHQYDANILLDSKTVSIGSIQPQKDAWWSFSKRIGIRRQCPVIASEHFLRVRLYLYKQPLSVSERAVIQPL